MRVWSSSSLPGVRKSDQVDAELLARLARADPRLLAPITHVGHQHYPDIARLRARALLVRTRTRLVTSVRSLVKTVGKRLPACGTHSFAAKMATQIPAELSPSLDPLIETIARLTAQIREYDRAVELAGDERYPATKLLRQRTRLSNRILPWLITPRLDDAAVLARVNPALAPLAASRD